jgi:signal transduction histidine kinase
MTADLVAVVSHELRTPLTSIRGALQLAIQDLGDESRLLGVALQNCERMVDLVNDLLDLSKIESGHAPLNPQPVSVSDVIARAIESMMPLADAAAVAVVSEIPAAVPLVEVDPNRMMQVLVNLLSNAIKVAPPATIVTVRATGGSRGFVDVSVNDHGRGIPSHELGRLFRKFEQLEGCPPGTGLGLVISKAIVEQHGGRIGVKSTVGIGTTFTVAMPAVRTANAASIEIVRQRPARVA